MIDLVGRISCEPMPAVNEERREVRYLYRVQTVLGEYIVIHGPDKRYLEYPFGEGDNVRVQGFLAPQIEGRKSDLVIHASVVHKTPVNPGVCVN